jgi:hypothetical protein
MQFKIKLQNAGSVGLHIYREWTIPDCPNKPFYINQGEEDMWAFLARDGQLISEQETLLYPEVMKKRDDRATESVSRHCGSTDLSDSDTQSDFSFGSDFTSGV